MNKKGMHFIAIALGVIVILLVVYGIGNVGYQFAKEKIFGEKGVLSGKFPEEKFVPGKITIDDDDLIAINSMKALVCALSVSASGSIDFSVCPNPDFVMPGITMGMTSAQATAQPTQPSAPTAPSTTTSTASATASGCSGVAYGQSCVTCNQPFFPKNSYDNKMSFEDLADFLVGCARNTKFAATKSFCGRIPQGASKEVFSRSQIESWFKSQSPPDIKAQYLTTFSFDIPEPLSPAKPYYVCTENSWFGTNKIYVYDNPAKDKDCLNAFREWSKESSNLMQISCKITPFEFRQKVSTLEEWITGSDDPKYLGYYEAFPIGEEAYWQIDEFSFLRDIVFYGAVMNALPVVGQVAGKLVGGVWRGLKSFVTGAAFKTADELKQIAIKKLASELGEKVSKEMAEKAARELFEVFGEKGYERLLQKDLFFENLLEQFSSRGIKQVGKESADAVAGRLSDDLFDLLEMNAVDRVILGKPAASADEIIDLMKGQADNLLKDADDATRALAKEQIEKAMKTPLDQGIKEAFKRKSAIKQFFTRNLLEETSAKGLRFSDEALKKLLVNRKAATEVLEKLPAEVRAKYLQRVESYMDDILKVKGDDIVLDYGKILGSTDTGLISKLENQYEIFFQNTYGDPANWVGLVPQLSRPLQLGKPITLLGLKVPILSRAGGALWASGKATAKDIYEIAWKNRVGRYFFAFMIADGLARADSMNEKFEPHGKDNMVLTRPFDYGTSKGKLFPLIGAESFYVDLTKEDSSHQRMFLASPCKADLSISNTLGNCQVPSGAYIVKMGTTVVPAEPASIAMMPGKSPTTTYYYDYLSAAEKKTEFEKCFNMYFPLTPIGDCENRIAKDPILTKQFIRYFYDRAYVPILDALVSGKMELVYFPDVNIGWMLRPLGTLNQQEQEALTLLSKISTVGRPGGGVSGAYYPLIRTLWYMILLDKKTIDETIKSSSKWEKTVKVEKLSFEGFSQKMMNFFASGSGPSVIQEHMIHALSTSNTINAELRKEKSFAWTAARETFYHTYNVDMSDINGDLIIKICDTKTFGQTSPFDFEIRKNVPLLSVKHDESPYPNYNNGYNYCISRYEWWVTASKWLTTAAAIAIDVGVGLTGVGLIVEAPVAILTGAGSAWAARALDQRSKWPK